MDVRFWLWTGITALLISVIIACALPRSLVPLKYKKVISWVPLVFAARLLFTSDHGAAETGITWLFLLGGAKLMFTDHEFWRPAGRVIIIIGIAGVLGTGARQSTQRGQPMQTAVTGAEQH